MHPFGIILIVLAFIFVIGLILFNVSSIDSDASAWGSVILVFSGVILLFCLLVGLIGNFSTEINLLPIESVSRTKDGFTTISYRYSDKQVKSHVCSLANTYIASEDKIRLSEHVKRNYYGMKNSSTIKVIVDSE
jgi:hypothetical protein